MAPFFVLLEVAIYNPQLRLRVFFFPHFKNDLNMLFFLVCRLFSQFLDMNRIQGSIQL